MGDGLKRVARIYGGLKASDEHREVEYVPTCDNLSAAIRRSREARGWRYLGMTDDRDFLIFEKTKPTP